MGKQTFRGSYPKRLLGQGYSQSEWDRHIDLFLSVSNSTPNTLKEIYDTLFNAMNEAGYLLGLARGRRRPW